MNFVNPLLLFGAAALTIPIIIHLFNKSRFQIVKWGAMHLLEAVIRTNQRRIKIEQLILLIIRASIPALLALCMALPLWQGAQKLLGDSKTSTVILLDNSYSMAASRAGVSNFSIARDESSRIINELKLGSDAQVVLMGEGGSGLLDEPTYDLARLTQTLQKTEAGYGSASIPTALDYAAGVFGHMHEASRQLIVMTDFQRISFEATEDAQVSEMIGRLKKMPIAPEITFFDIGAEVTDNVAVESMEFSRLMVGVGQKIQIRANVRNFGDAAYPDLRVYFKVDGKEISASQIRLGAREKGQVLFSHAFDKAGSHGVEIVADADALTADNGYLASITVRDKVPVLLVNGDPNPEPLKGETDFAEIALQPYSAGRVELADLITSKVIRPDDINSKALGDAAVVMLANVHKLNDDQVRALEEFVKNGGGLMIFPGNRIDSNWYGSALYKDGKGLLPLAYESLAGDLQESSPSMGIVSQHFDHAALDIFNDPRNGTLSDAAIKLWYKMKEPASGNASAEAASTLVRLDSGDPLLVEKPFGEGHVIECSIPVDADWSNLPMRPFYLPLLQRLTIYLASTVFPPRNLDVGKPIIAFLPGADAGKKAMLTTPEGLTVEVPIAKKNDRSIAQYGKTQRPGLYTLTPPSGQPMAYVVNASRKESDLHKLTDKEIADFAKTHGVTVVHSGAEFRELDHAQRYGMELWRPLLWALLAVLFLEIFLQQKFARARGKISRA